MKQIIFILAMLLSGMVMSSMKVRLLTQSDWSIVGMIVGRDISSTCVMGVDVGMKMSVGSKSGA